MVFPMFALLSYVDGHTASYGRSGCVASELVGEDDDEVARREIAFHLVGYALHVLVVG